MVMEKMGSIAVVEEVEVVEEKMEAIVVAEEVEVKMEVIVLVITPADEAATEG